MSVATNAPRQVASGAAASSLTAMATARLRLRERLGRGFLIMNLRSGVNLYRLCRGSQGPVAGPCVVQDTWTRAWHVQMMHVRGMMVMHGCAPLQLSRAWEAQRRVAGTRRRRRRLTCRRTVLR